MGEGNAAVQAVGRTFFRVTIIGYVLTGLAMFPAVIIGVSRHYFEYKIDRCSCVPVTNSTTSTSNEICVYGNDAVTVDIGWRDFTFTDWNHTVGCPEAEARYNTSDYGENLDEARSYLAFEDEDTFSIAGQYQRSKNPLQADESNGGAEAGEGVVAMQVVCTFLCIITYKMLKASFLTNGSHCSIGLALMTRINLLVCVGLIASIVSFWWLIEGRFGNDNEALTQALENVSSEICSVRSVSCRNFCSSSPWQETSPGNKCLLSSARGVGAAVTSISHRSQSRCRTPRPWSYWGSIPRRSLESTT